MPLIKKTSNFVLQVWYSVFRLLGQKFTLHKDLFRLYAAFRAFGVGFTLKSSLTFVQHILLCGQFKNLVMKLFSLI